MPKRRTTRPKAVAKPSKPTENNLTDKERSERLELMLKEFESQLRKYERDITKEKKTSCSFIVGQYTRLIHSIPHELSEMTLKEFVEAGGTFKAAQESVEQKRPVMSSRSRVSEIQSLTQIHPIGLECVMEENSDEVEDHYTAQMKPPLTKSTVQTAKKGKRTVTSQQPPSTTLRRTKRTTAATPLSTFGHGYWGNTPLITPKFDPSLPRTPDNIRTMRPGERLISIAGSPVHVDMRRGPARGMDEVDDLLSEFANQVLTPSKIEKIAQLVQGN